ncbi:hypothetical protein [[Phormidium] sp. ETS-05]|nr:hypothetical protein [[Phormidium] sp. ETS-05]
MFYCKEPSSSRHLKINWHFLMISTNYQQVSGWCRSLLSGVDGGQW